MPIICTHPPETLERLTEGCWCGVCGQRVWPPLVPRSSPYRQAWSGDVWAEDRIRKIEELGDVPESGPVEEIGR